MSDGVTVGTLFDVPAMRAVGAECHLRGMPARGYLYREGGAKKG